MSWLEQYSLDQYLDILHLLHAFRQGVLMFGTFVEQLDHALDIWNSQPEDWSDPLLNDLADLLRTYAGGHHLELSQLTITANVQTQTTISQLWDHMLPLYIQRGVRQLLAAVDAFDEGQLTIHELEQKMWVSLCNLEDFVPADWYNEVKSAAYALEEIEETIERRGGSLDADVQGWLTETVMTLRRILDPGQVPPPVAASIDS